MKMELFVKIVCYVLFLPLIIAQKKSFDGVESEMTINVRPGFVDCFYQRAKPQDILEIEYQVIDSIFSDMNVNQELDINFQLFSPQGKELISDYKKSDANHRHEVKEAGDYKFCFDNRHSLLSVKTVYFDVYIDNESADDDQWDDYDFSPELLYNDTMDQIKISIAKVKEYLNEVKHHQDQLKAIESRDRNLQEHNFTRVNHFSILIIIVMMVVGAVQVVLVRSLFEENSKLHKFFKSLS
ncbi:transmembrane emp24 domain-containing protein 5 [Parasteatoda tepidariorum]|uniref:transmembrane emp24 domain-containing protein 5 n=1 Tax=Parasteatoda tepidariorum TaxID=114398 RepID=UPI00077FCC18|nr:transmembrane emp24 domain-containing protein 5 [Parasteatoda tepidariorum]